VAEAHADAQGGAAVHRALQETAALLELAAVLEHGGEVPGDERGALQRVVVALLGATGDVERLGAVGQRVERGAGGHLRGHLERELGLVDDALHAGVEPGVLRPRLGVAHAEERRPLGAGVGRGDRDHRQPGRHRHRLGRVHDASAAERDEAVGALGQRRRLAHAADLRVRLRPVEAPRDRQLGVLPELLGDEQRVLHAELVEHLRERVQTPAHDHRRTISDVRLPCTAVLCGDG
jgi:hypothetical protein